MGKWITNRLMNQLARRIQMKLNKLALTDRKCWLLYFGITPKYAAHPAAEYKAYLDCGLREKDK